MTQNLRRSSKLREKKKAAYKIYWKYVVKREAEKLQNISESWEEDENDMKPYFMSVEDYIMIPSLFLFPSLVILCLGVDLYLFFPYVQIVLPQ